MYAVVPKPYSATTPVLSLYIIFTPSLNVDCEPKKTCHFIFVFLGRFLPELSGICRRNSVRLSVVCLPVTFVYPTQPVEIFGNVSMPSCTLAIPDLRAEFTAIGSGEPLRLGLNARGNHNPMVPLWTF